MRYQAGIYIAGLGRKSGTRVDCRVRGAALEIRRGPRRIMGLPSTWALLGWRDHVALADVASVTMEQGGDHIDAGRVLGTGVVGLFWKKHRFVLRLRMRDDVRPDVLIAGDAAPLDRLQTAIARARAEAAA